MEVLFGAVKFLDRSMTSELKATINGIIDREKQIMILFKDGKVFLLRDHYKFLDPEDAPKIFLGRAPSTIHIHSRASNRFPGARKLYLTERWK